MEAVMRLTILIQDQEAPAANVVRIQVVFLLAVRLIDEL